MQHPPSKVRAIVVTQDKKRYLTRWKPWKPFELLGADEPTSSQEAIRAANRLANRRALVVKQIDVQYLFRNLSRDAQKQETQAVL